MTFQLFSIDSSSTQNVVVAGLGDRAFLLVQRLSSSLTTKTTSPVLFELLPPTVDDQTGNQQNCQQQQQQQQPLKQDVCAVAVHCPKGGAGGGGGEESMKGGDCCCIVARTDKSLCVYAIKLPGVSPSSSSPSPATSGVTGFSPTITYRSPKRVTSLTFGSLPDGRSVSSAASSTSSSSTSSTSKPLPRVPVLITADVVGDSYAYSLDRKHMGTRLLLGHTASMLTGVMTMSTSSNSDNDSSNSSSSKRMLCSNAIVGSDQLVLTSDRDEKIRISYFPETYKIHGYLLGHTEYVSSFDVAKMERETETGSNDSSPLMLAVSCGGDLTIRLWDIALKQELCVVCVDQRNESMKNELPAAQDRKVDDTSTGEGEEGDTSPSPSHSPRRIPTDIAINKSGTLVGVIFDDCSDIEIYRVSLQPPSIPASDSTPSNSSSPPRCSLSIACTTTCDGQPLSIDFAPDQNDTIMVVMQEPRFVRAYQIIDGPDNEALKDTTVWNDWFDQLRSYATSLHITMPSTILEKDEHGNPKIQRAMETRGPSNSTQDGKQLPWNRVERVGSAKKKESRRNKRRKLAAEEQAMSSSSNPSS